MTYRKRFQTFESAFRAAQREFRKGCTWVVSPMHPKMFQIFDGKKRVMEIEWGFDLVRKEK